MTANESKSESNRWVSILRRPTLGPFLFGSLFGGIPLAIAFSRLGGRLVSPELIRFVLDLTPLAVIVTTIEAVWNADRGWKQFVRTILITSLSACVPLPLFVSSVLMWRFGYDLFSWSGFPVLTGIFILWSVAVALPSWLIAIGTVSLFRRKDKKYFRGDATIL